MLQLATIDFLKELKLNNHKEWFEKNRKRYEYAKVDYLQLVGEVGERKVQGRSGTIIMSFVS